MSFLLFWNAELRLATHWKNNTRFREFYTCLECETKTGVVRNEAFARKEEQKKIG